MKAVPRKLDGFFISPQRSESAELRRENSFLHNLTAMTVYSGKLRIQNSRLSNLLAVITRVPADIHHC